MGKLISRFWRMMRRALRQPRFRQLLAGWSLPVLLTLLLLIGVHVRVKADPAPTSTELQLYLQTHQLGVFEMTSGDYPQIFYTYQGHAVQLTSGDHASLKPISDGQYVAWVSIIDGQSQVFLEDVLSGSVIQLSQVSPNEGLTQFGNHLAWQGWDGQNWQIYYYDGTSVQQITNSPNSSFNAHLNGNQLLYATQLDTDDWQAYAYDLASGQAAPVREGDTASTAFPHFEIDGTIATGFVPY